MTESYSYKASGIDIDATDELKRRMASSVESGDSRVLNQFGAFAPLLRGTFDGINEPILVVKTDEPGSKQKLAFELDRLEDLCRDLVNHTVNDVVVMGARPVYVTDCIVGGRLDSDVIERLVRGIAVACRENDCVLVGGETSIQPGVVTDGLYVLSATVIGVVEKERVIDGRGVEPGDVVLGAASNGLHTNGYTLVRSLLDSQPELATKQLADGPFLDVVMRPHRAYSEALQGLFGQELVHGLAHITGGGLRDNLVRILPSEINAEIDMGRIRPTEVFNVIREAGSVSDEDMLRTFNLGVGLVVVCGRSAVDNVCGHLKRHGIETWELGETSHGDGIVDLRGEIVW